MRFQLSRLRTSWAFLHENNTTEIHSIFVISPFSRTTMRTFRSMQICEKRLRNNITFVTDWNWWTHLVAAECDKTVIQWISACSIQCIQTDASSWNNASSIRCCANWRPVRILTDLTDGLILGASMYRTSVRNTCSARLLLYWLRGLINNRTRPASALLQQAVSCRTISRNSFKQKYTERGQGDARTDFVHWLPKFHAVYEKIYLHENICNMKTQKRFRCSRHQSLCFSLWAIH